MAEDRVLQADAVAAEHAPHAPRDFERHRHVSALAQTDLRRSQPTRVLEPPELIRQQLTLADTLQRIDELVLRQLESANRSTKLLAKFRVPERGFVARHRRTHHAEDNPEPGLVER